MSEEQLVLICERIDRHPHVPSREGTCDKCGHPIWIAKSSPKADLNWCVECTVPAIAFDPDVQVRDLTLAQIADIEAYRKRHAQ